MTFTRVRRQTYYGFSKLKKIFYRYVDFSLAQNASENAKKMKKQKYQPFHTFVPPLPDLVKTEQKFKKNKTKSRLPICSNN